MKILKWFKDDPLADILEETLENCIERTEGSGWYKKGTVVKLLEKGEIIETPFACYRKDVSINMKEITDEEVLKLNEEGRPIVVFNMSMLLPVWIKNITNQENLICYPISMEPDDYYHQQKEMREIMDKGKKIINDVVYLIYDGELKEVF